MKDAICGRCLIRGILISKNGEKLRVIGSLLLVILGLIMPLFVTERTFGILESLKRTLINRNTDMLISVSLKMVALNTMRSMPIYMGILLAMELVFIQLRKRTASPIWRRLSLPAWYLVSFALLLGTYTLIDWFYGLSYHIDLPAVFILLVIRMLNRIPTKVSSKVLIIVLFFTSMQALDIAPALTQFGFGRGEISLDIKNAAKILGSEGVLHTISGMMFLAFSMCTGLMFLLSLEQRQRLRIAQANYQMQEQLYITREEAIHNRNFREMQTLVHDLKMPLTAISGLASLTILMKPGEKAKEYQQRICEAAERMSEMISLMLYPDKRTKISSQKLLETIMASFSTNQHVTLLRTENACPELELYINVIRVTRAMINLLENASRAVDPKDGDILIRFNKDAEFFHVLVCDNGQGINKKSMEKIWEPGYSGGRSSGFGLSFVKQVITEHQGQVELESVEGNYTTVSIKLPVVKVECNE